jgi:hypothetical protein
VSADPDSTQPAAAEVVVLPSLKDPFGLGPISSVTVKAPVVVEVEAVEQDGDRFSNLSVDAGVSRPGFPQPPRSP